MQTLTCEVQIHALSLRSLSGRYALVREIERLAREKLAPQVGAASPENIRIVRQYDVDRGYARIFIVEADYEDIGL